MRLGNSYFFATVWIIPALIVFFIWAFRRKNELITRFVSQDLRDRLMSGVSVERQKLKAALIVAGCTFLILALLRPQWGFHWEETKRRGVDIVIALDVSKSMLAEDVSPNRLERAKRKISDFLKIVQGDRIGLIAFAGTAFLQCPLTLDHGAVQLFLETVDTDLIPVPGTSIANAVELAIDAFKGSKRNSRALILITDGEETTGSDLEAAKKANDQGIKIYTIGIGKEEGAPIPNREGGGFKKDRQGNVILTKLDEQGLQKVALETGGSYVRSVSGDLDLENIYADLKKHTEDKELKSGRQKRFEERFQWPLFLAFLCLFIETILSERKGASVSLASYLQRVMNALPRKAKKAAMISVLLLLPAGAFGASAGKGERLYQQQKYNDALKELVDAQVENPTSLQIKYNTANAYYKTNQYQEAEKLFQAVATSGDTSLSEKAFYNLGNTSYRQGKLQEALAFYQKATELDPKDEDAKYNLEFVRKEIRRRMNENQKQQGQPQPSGGGGNKDKKDQKNDKNQTGKGQSQPKPPEGKKDDKNKDGANSEQAKAGSQDDKEKGEGGQGSARKMSDEEAKQWLSTLKEGDRSKFQKQQIQGDRQYEVEKDW